MTYDPLRDLRPSPRLALCRRNRSLRNIRLRARKHKVAAPAFRNQFPVSARLLGEDPEIFATLLAAFAGGSANQRAVAFHLLRPNTRNFHPHRINGSFSPSS